MTARKRKHWTVYSKTLGMGPTFRTRREAREERDMILESEPDDAVSITPVMMTEAEYGKLQEHPGY